MGTYATPDHLRAETDDTPATLDDAEAERLIATAEDRVDEMIGAALLDTTTGRKVTPGDLAAWRQAKLTRATVLLAALARRKPTAFDPPAFANVSGPDFSKSQPIGSGISGAARTTRRQAATLLTDAGLRVTAVRASA